LLGYAFSVLSCSHQGQMAHKEPLLFPRPPLFQMVPAFAARPLTSPHIFDQRRNHVCLRLPRSPLMFTSCRGFPDFCQPPYPSLSHTNPSLDAFFTYLISPSSAPLPRIYSVFSLLFSFVCACTAFFFALVHSLSGSLFLFLLVWLHSMLVFRLPTHASF